MPRSNSYYDSYVQDGGVYGSGPSIPVAAPQAQPEIQVQPSPPQAAPIHDLKDPQVNAELDRITNRGFFSFFGEGLREVFSGPQPNWDQMSAGDKTAALAKGTGHLAWNTAKAIPANIIKAPIQVGYSALEGIDTASQKILGTDSFVPDKIDLTGIIGNNWAGRYLGDITGFKAPYKEAKALGGDTPWGNLLAVISSTGKVAGDVAISADMVNTIRGAFKPTLKTVDGKITGQDFRPLQPDQLSQIKMKVSELTGGKYQPTISFEQNPTSSFFKVPESAAAKYGGDSSNTFLKVSPAGNGSAEFSVVQLRASALAKGIDYMKSKFGQSNVLDTEIGPVIKVDSGIIQYDPAAAGGDALPDFFKPSGAAELTPEAATAASAVGARAATIDGVRPISQGITLYRGGSTFQPAKVTGEGASFTTSPDVAAKFDKMAKGKGGTGKLEQFTLNPSAKILEVSQLSSQVLKTEMNEANILKYAKQNGYDVVDFRGAPKEWLHNQEQEFRVLNPAVVENQVSIPPDMPDFLQPTMQELQAAAKVKPPSALEFSNNRKMDIANQGAAAEMGVQYPSPVNRPLKGLEDAPITEKQIGQINFMQQQRELPDQMVQAISAVLTGKGNLSDLTQKEAFDVSETIRMFNQKPAELPGEKDMFLRPFINPARYWLEAAERKLGYPVYSQGYIPIETGARLSKVFQDELATQARDVFGKYADPAKYLEERRLLTNYIEGDKGAITNNTALDPATKADLVKVGDWLQGQFQNFFEAAGIKSDRFLGQYAPKIRQLGTIYNLYKNSDVPPEMRPFFTFERGGMDQPVEDDALVLYDIYARALSRDKFMRGPLEQAKDVAGKLPPNLQKSFNDYLQEKLGFQGEPEKALNRWGMKLNTATNGAIPADIFRKAINFLMTNSYAATLGLPRVVPVVANLMQSFLMSYPELGPKYFAMGWKRFFEKGALDELNKSGMIPEKGYLYGGELASEASKGVVGKAFDLYQKAQNATMIPFSKTEILNRGVTYFGVKQRFLDNWTAFRDGQISYDDFEKGISMDGFNPTLQGILREKFSQNTPESLQEAQDLMTQDILDSTNFPYRKGAESRAFYGLKGKFGLQYGIWPFEYAQTIKSWIARRQWQKLIRWYAMATVMDRSVKDALGVDMSRYLLLGPLSSIPLGPLANAAWSFGKALNASFQDLTDQQDQYFGDVASALKNYGGSLVGVGMQRLKHLEMSVNRYKQGIAVSTDPDPQKKFGIYSTTGKLKEWVTFGDLLKYTLGFTNEETAQQNDKLNAIRKDTLKYNDKVTEAMNALVDGDFKKFDKIVVDNQLQIGDISAKLKSYQVPLDQRLFDQMPAQLKAKYLPVFYPAQ